MTPLHLAAYFDVGPIVTTLLMVSKVRTLASVFAQVLIFLGCPIHTVLQHIAGNLLNLRENILLLQSALDNLPKV